MVQLAKTEVPGEGPPKMKKLFQGGSDSGLKKKGFPSTRGPWDRGVSWRGKEKGAKKKKKKKRSEKGGKRSESPRERRTQITSGMRELKKSRGGKKKP